MKTLLEIYQEEPAGVGQGDKGTTHNYIQEYYIQALEPYRNTKNTVLEIGIFFGHSIRMWRKYFKDAKIVAIDIENRNSVCDGCELIYGDATIPETSSTIDNVDVIIDDGCHFSWNQIKVFNILFPKLNPGGIYIIEDVLGEELDKGVFDDLHPDMKVIDMRENMGHDNIIIEIRK